MGQQRETKERSRSRSPDKLGWQSALQTKFPMGGWAGGPGNCAKLPRYARRPRSPQTVSARVQSPKKTRVGSVRYFRRTPHADEMRGTIRKTTTKSASNNINTHASNAIDGARKTIANTQTSTTADGPSYGNMENAASAHP